LFENFVQNAKRIAGIIYSYGDSSRFERDSLLTPPGGGDQIAANVGREVFLSRRVFAKKEETTSIHVAHGLLIHQYNYTNYQYS